MRDLLRIRDARLYLLGDVVSTLGDNALWLAMAIWVKELTGSSGWAGLVMFCFVLGNLLSPLGGVLADRFRRRPLLVAVNALAGALVLLVLLVHGRGQLWLIYLVMFGYGVAGSVTGPADTAFTPSIVPAELLAEANGLRQTLRQGLRLVTPLAGAGLFAAAGGGAVAIADAATFAVAIACLAALRVAEATPGHGLVAAGAGPTEAGDGQPAGVADAPSADTPARPVGPPGGMSAGFRFLLREPVLRAITIALAMAVVAFGVTESAGFSVATEGLHRSAAFMGPLLTTQGVGAVGGGLLAAPLLRRVGEPLLVAIALAATVAALLLLTLPSLVSAVTGMLIVGFALPWLLVATTTALQRRTPGELLGRVSGAFELALTVPQVSSIGIGAALITVVDYRVLLVAVAAIVAAAACYLFAAPVRPVSETLTVSETAASVPDRS